MIVLNGLGLKIYIKKTQTITNFFLNASLNM